MSELVHLSICFMLVFAGFLPAQSLMTTIFGQIGFWSLFVLYVAFSISSLLGPFLVNMVPLNRIIYGSSCFFTLYIIACIIAHSYRERFTFVLFVASVLLGSAFGPMWVAQCAYLGRLTRNSPQVIGRVNGTFLGIYFSSGILGNILLSIVNYTGGDSSQLPVNALLYVLLVVVFTGSVASFFLKEPLLLDMEDLSSKDTAFEIMSMLSDKCILFVIPYCMFLGFGLTFSWGIFPKLLPEVYMVPLMACCYGFGNLLSCFVAGHVFDLYGWVPLVAYHAFVIVISFSSIELAVNYKITWLFFLASLILGSFEGVGNSLIQSTLMKMFCNRVSEALTIFRVFSGIGVASGFLLGLLLQYEVFMFLFSIMCSLTLIIYCYHYRGVQFHIAGHIP